MKKKVSYTPGEQRLLSIIADFGRTTSDQIMEKFYAGRKPPFHARQAFMAGLTQLIKKVNHNKEDFRIIKGERRGPYPTEISYAARRKG